jgi:hypothetical protein
LNLLTEDFQGHPRFLIRDDKFMQRVLRAPQASSANRSKILTGQVPLWE